MDKRILFMNFIDTNSDCVTFAVNFIVTRIGYFFSLKYQRF